MLGSGNMKKKINSYVFTFMTLMLGMFTSEIIFRLINESSLLDISVIRIFCEMSIIASILTLVFMKFKLRMRRLLVLFVVLASNIYACLQLGFNNFLGVYISFQTSSQFEAVKDYVADFVRSFKGYYFLTLIPFIIVLAMYIILKM